MWATSATFVVRVGECRFEAQRRFRRAHVRQRDGEIAHEVVQHAGRIAGRGLIKPANVSDGGKLHQRLLAAATPSDALAEVEAPRKHRVTSTEGGKHDLLHGDKRSTRKAVWQSRLSVVRALFDRSKSRGRYVFTSLPVALLREPAREVYWLKGALLFDLWFDVPHRHTRDADFLGFGPADTEVLAAVMREVCSVAVDDGMIFDPASITAEEIREDNRYGG
jgi:Nucleotidyl transferase AbiEii toxin, Type IV TA system